MASIKDSKALDTFARAMIEKYHCPVRPNEPPRDILATLAFLVCTSVVLKYRFMLTFCNSGPWLPNSSPRHPTTPRSRQNTGGASRPNWPTCTRRTARSVIPTPAGSCKSWFIIPAYQQCKLFFSWEDKVIDEDQAKYRGSAPGMCTADATSREALAESGSNQQPSSTSSPADAAGPSTDTRMDAAPMFSLYGASAVPVDIPAYAMDSNVDLRTLGDIAGAIEKNL